MALMRFHHFLPFGAIACLALSGSIACQRSPETIVVPDTSDETAGTSTPADTATPSTESPAPSAGEASVQSEDESAIADANGLTTSGQACSVSAFVADPDPAGLNVRSGPGSNFSVIDTLPTDGPVEVTITEAAGGWMKLDVAWSMQQQELEQPGWVYAPLLGVTTKDGSATDAALVPLFSTPNDSDTNVKARVPKFSEASLLSCAGDWLQVQTEEAAGWLAAADQCSSPVTTCP
jgi:SH3-like domain-containing protein